MDPTIAALAGAFIGMAGTVVAPILTSRRAHKARRRELMREAYAEGMRVITESAKQHDAHGYRMMEQRLFEARVQIRLVGTEATSKRFDRVTNGVARLLRMLMAEVAKPVAEQNLSACLDEISEADTAAQIEAVDAFIASARRDIGMADPTPVQIWRVIRAKLRRFSAQ